MVAVDNMLDNNVVKYSLFKTKERKVNTTIASVMSLNEPVMIVAVVLVVLIALYLLILSRAG